MSNVFNESDGQPRYTTNWSRMTHEVRRSAGIMAATLPYTSADPDTQSAIEETFADLCGALLDVYVGYKEGDTSQYTAQLRENLRLFGEYLNEIRVNEEGGV